MEHDFRLVVLHGPPDILLLAHITDDRVHAFAKSAQPEKRWVRVGLLGITPYLSSHLHKPGRQPPTLEASVARNED